MNPEPIRLREPGEDWQRELREAIRDPRELLAMLGLDESPLAREIDRDPQFRVRVPRHFARLMRHGDAQDPLLMQVLALSRERDEVPGYVIDPLGEASASPLPALLHKYHGRALLMSTPACAVHCRYCFRREFPYEQHTDAGALAAALDHLRADPTITEVILSGGDPLTLRDTALQALLERIEAIPHITRLRIHTRTPVVIPRRVNDALLALLAARRLPVAIVLHANHANELDPDFARAAARLRESGATLLNQSVLLAGVNDSVDRLAALSERLFACGILPYYLHLLDPVRGSAHFAVGEDHALELIRQLRDRLPGYLVPRLARERAGDASKQVLA